MNKKRNVIFGFLGTQLDAGWSPKRWHHWRPTVGLVGQEQVPVDRIELFMCKEADHKLAKQVVNDITSVSPHTEVVLRVLDLEDPWNFPAMFGALRDCARHYDFKADEDYFIHLSTGTHVAQICLFLLTEAHYFPAKLLGARRSPGENALPWQSHVDVIDLNLSSYDELASRFQQERHDAQSMLKRGIVTRNAQFNATIARVEKIAVRSPEPVLILGPTGSGKSLLASGIYELRVRERIVSGKFVEVDCSTLQREHANSDLFGHKKGAFTGATSDRSGFLKEADGGVLFLDEIGNLDLEQQAMLLVAIDRKTFRPMGSDKEVKSNFQLIAGTNMDLFAAVEAGTFRRDLLERICTWTFELPGLAERREDIEPNLDYELECVSQKLNKAISMNADARHRYLAYAMKAAWPGNFRAFKASIYRMARLADGGRIRLDEVGEEIEVLKRHQPRHRAQPVSGILAQVLGEAAEEIDAFDRPQLEKVLEIVGHSESLAEAGRKLFDVSRSKKNSSNDTTRLSKYLTKFDLSFAQVKQALSSMPAEVD